MSDHHETNYFKIYVTLLVLLVISIAGPEIGIKWVTLLTAFGIAIVKAWLVINHFMHLNVEKMIVKWFLVTSTVLLALYFFGVAPDVMNHEGQRWVNLAAQEAVERGIEEEHHDEEGDHADEEPHLEDQLAMYAEVEAFVPRQVGGFDAAGQYTSLCASCHGATGGGDGAAGAALNPPPANFTDAAFWGAAVDADLVQVILQGGGPMGKSAAMPAWSAMMDESQATEMLEYLKTMQGN